MESFDLLKAIIRDYAADITLPFCHNYRNNRFMIESFKRSATEEILQYVKKHDPFDPVRSLELFIEEMDEAAHVYAKSSIMFLVFEHTAIDILDILKASVY